MDSTRGRIATGQGCDSNCPLARRREGPRWHLNIFEVLAQSRQRSFLQTSADLLDLLKAQPSQN